MLYRRSLLKIMSTNGLTNGCPVNGVSLNDVTNNGVTQNGDTENNFRECTKRKSAKKIVYVAPINGEDFVIPDASRKCTWNKDARNNGVPFPHTIQNRYVPEKIVPNILKLIGNTPMVKLNSVTKKAGIKCNIYAKLEYFNPGGSIKDRIAKRMIEDAEEQGLLKPGMTIIEPSSGNTGIGVALISAIKGYKCIIVMSEKMSNEKVAVMNALGAKLIRTPITADSYSPEGIFGVASRLHQEIPNSLILDQFSNPGNPLAHYDTTAEEILEQCDNKVDVLVLGAGTGGTITGISRKFKEVSPQTKIIGVDPKGSVFALPDSINNTDVTFFEVEGLGYDFVPTSLDQTVVDVWMKTDDEGSLTMARRLIREEGILCGTSSGAAVSAAVEVAKTLKEGQNLVVVIPDSIRNYITKFVSDHWMEERGFQPCENINNHWWWNDSIHNLNYRQIDTVFANESCNSVLAKMRQENLNEMAVLKHDGNILGTITLKHLINYILAKYVLPHDDVESCTIRIYPKIDVNTGHVGLVSRILEKNSYVVITESNGLGHSRTENPIGILDIRDLYEYINSKEECKTHHGKRS